MCCARGLLAWRRATTAAAMSMGERAKLFGLRHVKHLMRGEDRDGCYLHVDEQDVGPPLDPQADGPNEASGPMVENDPVAIRHEYRAIGFRRAPAPCRRLATSSDQSAQIASQPRKATPFATTPASSIGWRAAVFKHCGWTSAI